MTKKELNDILLTINNCSSLEELDRTRVSYLGRKGHFNKMMSVMPKMSHEERVSFGKEINHLKYTVNVELLKKHLEIEEVEYNKTLEKERIDVSANLSKINRGTIHPINRTTNEIIDFFKNLGYQIHSGPEVEHEENNFSSLNIGKNHPSRELFDTFFLKSNDLLLRTHCTNVTARTLKEDLYKTKLASVSVGNVYRKDKDDSSHTHQFTQIDGFFVGEGITMSNLIWTLKSLCKTIFGTETQSRFLPSYFPFTCPSTEVNTICWNCNNNGAHCPLCKGTGWLEILGAGMLHPKVLKNCGWNNDNIKGFAFGIGVERVAMLKYLIPDIRLFFKNNIKFLRQF